jgi:hypothetical protein
MIPTISIIFCGSRTPLSIDNTFAWSSNSCQWISTSWSSRITSTGCPPTLSVSSLLRYWILWWCWMKQGLFTVISNLKIFYCEGKRSCMIHVTHPFFMYVVWNPQQSRWLTLARRVTKSRLYIPISNPDSIDLPRFWWVYLTQVPLTCGPWDALPPNSSWAYLCFLVARNTIKYQGSLRCLGKTLDCGGGNLCSS